VTHVWLGAGAVVLVTALTLLISTYALRLSRTTSDFYVASRSVSPVWNASAIGGEYLSAASFLGVAGLILAYGLDMLWYPVGYTAGYLVLLVLVAAPLRRSGAYTLPDFAESRLESLPVRRIASVLVVLIGWLYLLPQFVGAALTLRLSTGIPGPIGALLVAVVVVASVAAGGMRSITFVQTFQYWLKLTALAVPIIFVLIVWNSDGRPSPDSSQAPVFDTRTVVTMPSDATFHVTRPVRVTVDGTLDGVRRDAATRRLTRGDHRAAKGTELTFPAGAAVPVDRSLAPSLGHGWALPLSATTDHPLYGTYSLMLALFFGAMGLPHVLVRFYTNPDGRTARRTTLIVLCLLGGFYILPTIYGSLARLYTPELLLTGNTDGAVLLLPAEVVGGRVGDLLQALVTAGAFAAFLSTSSGLTVSVGGVLSQDLLRGTVRDFRIAGAFAAVVPFVLSLFATTLSVADIVGLAFAVAASSFCPLLLLGIWWRRLTAVAAAAGLIVGGGLATAAVLVTIIGGQRDGWVGALLSRPAAWTMPIAFLVMVAISINTPERIPAGVGRTMVRLHAPEAVLIDRDPR
jgi:Na+(H+)/acetate symporter ActP